MCLNRRGYHRMSGVGDSDWFSCVRVRARHCCIRECGRRCFRYTGGGGPSRACYRRARLLAGYRDAAWARACVAWVPRGARCFRRISRSGFQSGFRHENGPKPGPNLQKTVFCDMYRWLQGNPTSSRTAGRVVHEAVHAGECGKGRPL